MKNVIYYVKAICSNSYITFILPAPGTNSMKIPTEQGLASGENLGTAGSLGKDGNAESDRDLRAVPCPE